MSFKFWRVCVWYVGGGETGLDGSEFVRKTNT